MDLIGNDRSTGKKIVIWKKRTGLIGKFPRIIIFLFLTVKRGKVLIVVNVASQCGYTESNYTQLKELLEAYHDRGAVHVYLPKNAKQKNKL